MFIATLKKSSLSRISAYLLLALAATRPHPTHAQGAATDSALTKDANANLALVKAVESPNPGAQATALALIDQGADVNGKNNLGYPLLVIAAARRDFADVTIALLAKGATVNGQGPHGATALIAAAWRGDLSLVKLLLDKGADLQAKDSAGFTAVGAAAAAGQFDLVNYLLAHGAHQQDINAIAPPAFFFALKQNVNEKHWLEVVNYFVAHSVSVNARDAEGTPALNLAASWGGQATIGRFLIEHGADVNATDKNGWTALMRAAYAGALPFVRLLLEHGAKVNAQAPGGLTALMGAVSEPIFQLGIHGQDGVATVQLLLANGADANARDVRGKSVLAYAETNEQPTKSKIILLLKQAGAKP